MSETMISADSSGIDFLSNLPVGWNVKALGAVCEPDGGVQTGPFGSQLHAADYVAEGIPSIMPVNIGDNRIVEEGIARIKPDDAKRLSKYLVAKGDIVYSRRGDVERRALVTDKEDGWLCGTGCLRVRLQTSVNSVYASYYLGHPEVKAWIVRHAQGATMPNLNTSILSQLPFAVPPRDAQDAIAHFLASVDAKVDVLRKQNQTLEAMARAIFKSWFVDFDPVRAKAEGRTPEGMDAATAALFPSTFTDSPLGPIPEGWCVSEIGKEVTVQGGSTPSTKEPKYWEGGSYNWVTPKDLSNASSPILLTTDRLLTKEGVGQITSGQLAVDTVLLSSRAPIGYLALAKIPVSINQGFIAMVCNKILSPVWVLNWTYSVMEEIKGRASGTTFAEISKATFRPIPVVVPTQEIMTKFSAIVTPLYEKICTNDRQIKALSEMRDTLLPRLISGKLRMTDAQALTEDAA